VASDHLSTCAENVEHPGCFWPEEESSIPTHEKPREIHLSLSSRHLALGIITESGFLVGASRSPRSDDFVVAGFAVSVRAHGLTSPFVFSPL